MDINAGTLTALTPVSLAGPVTQFIEFANHPNTVYILIDIDS